MGYSTGQAARIAGCTAAQLSHWRRTGLTAPTGTDSTYSFRDLVAIRVVTSLLESGLSLARIRAALDYLRQAGDDIAGLRLVTDGSSVWACHDDGETLEALGSGQLALFLSVGHFVDAIESEVRAFAAERQAFVERLSPDVSDHVGADDASERH